MLEKFVFTPKNYQELVNLALDYYDWLDAVLSDLYDLKPSPLKADEDNEIHFYESMWQSDIEVDYMRKGFSWETLTEESIQYVKWRIEKAVQENMNIKLRRKMEK